MKDDFEEAMKNLNLIDDVNNLSNHAIAEDYLSYLEYQNDDFSIPRDEVWDARKKDGYHPKPFFYDTAIKRR